MNTETKHTPTPKWEVQICDPSQGLNKVAEREFFSSYEEAQAYVDKQSSFDHFNRYKIVAPISPTPYHLVNDVGFTCALVAANGKTVGHINVAHNVGPHAVENWTAEFVKRACNEHAALCAVAEVAQKMYESGFASDQELFEQAISNLAAIRNLKPKLTGAEHNAFPKGRW